MTVRQSNRKMSRKPKVDILRKGKSGEKREHSEEKQLKDCGMRIEPNRIHFIPSRITGQFKVNNCCSHFGKKKNRKLHNNQNLVNYKADNFLTNL